MYGGHITDGFDRRLNNTYLANLIVPEVLQSYQLGPSFRTPDPAKTEFASYQKFVEEKTPPENPQVYCAGRACSLESGGSALVQAPGARRLMSPAAYWPQPAAASRSSL